MRSEEALYEQINALLHAVKKDSKLKAIATATAIDADKNYIMPLFQFQNVGYPIKYNWTTQVGIRLP